MSTYQLNIYHLTDKGSVRLLNGKTHTLKTLANHQDQIVNKKGELIPLDNIPKAELVGNDLYIYLEDGTNEEPNLIMQDYALFSTIEDFQLLTQTNTTFNTNQPQQPLTLAKPIITIDNVTDDNVITRIEAEKESIQLNGQVDTERGGNISVNVILNTKTYPAKIIGNQWFATINTSDLTTIQGKQHLIVQAIANKTELVATSELKKEYMVDTQIEHPIIEIDPITANNILEYVESKTETIHITGKIINVEHSAAKSGNEVVIHLGNSTSTGKLTTDVNGELIFSIPVSTVSLIAHQSEGITLSLSTTDSVGNVLESQKSKNYQVNLERNINVSVNTITNDNIINQAESKEDITIQGAVTNGEEGESIGIYCSCPVCASGWRLLQEVPLNSLGAFNLTVNGEELISNAGESPVIRAIYRNQPTKTTDKEYSIDREYSIDTELNKPITTAPKLIKNQSSTGSILSGELDNIDNDVNASNVEVLVTIDGQVHKASVSEDKRSWTLLQSNTQLSDLEHKSVTAKVLVTDKAGNTNESDEVKAEFLPQINITEIGDSFSVNNIGPLVTISGEVNYSGLFASGRNASFVRIIKVKIGKNTFEVPMNADGKTFDLKLPFTEALALDNKEISFSFNKVSVFSPKTNNDGSIGFETHKNQAVTTESIILKSDYITPNGNNGYNLSIKSPSSIIAGEVIGDNIAVGETIEITVGNKVFNASVEQDKTFRIAVENQFLAGSGDSQITATLKTTNLAGESVEVKDTETFTSTLAVSGSYNQPRHNDVEFNARQYNHLSDNFNFHYFMDTFYSAKLGAVDYGRVPFGGLGNTPVIKYHFATLEEMAIHHKNAIKPLSISAQQKDAFRKAYEYIAKFTNLKFEEVDNYITDGSGTNIFAKTHNGGGAAYASVGDGSWIWVNSAFGNENGSTTAPRIANLYNNVLNYVYYAAMHEVLHTLGFNHSNVLFTDNNYRGKYNEVGLGSKEDKTEFTYMSYNGLFETKGSYIPFYDLAALHYRYGVNKTVRSGNNIYGFQRYRDVNSDGNGVYIWDGGGVDTFDATNERERVYINLKPGSWIYRGDTAEKMMTIKSITDFNAVQFFGDEVGVNKTAARGTQKITEYVEGQAFIGFGTQIENAIGSVYNDILLGNDAANNLIGNGGNDILRSGKGDDYLHGGIGDDEMHGGEGNDTYVVDSNKDQVFELENQGIDTVYSSINFELPENVESLTLLGTIATQATGNNLSNTLIANNIGNTLNGKEGDDHLIGGLGEDILIGGTGKDTFVFNTTLNGKVDIIKDFENGDTIELAKSIFSAIENAEQVFDFISFNKGELSYKPNATTEAIHFATLENFYTNLETANFSII